MTGSKSDRTKQLQRDFLNEVSEFLKPNHYKGTALLKFLKHQSARWRVAHLDPYELLSEGIRRGYIHISRTRQPITNPEAWLRSVCLNILRDEVKKAIKDQRLAKQWKDNSYIPDTPLAQAELLDQLEKLQQALQRLPIPSQELLQWRFYERKTYQQICELLIRRDGEQISAATLRKRESRALKNLKRIFLQIYQSETDVTH